MILRYYRPFARRSPNFLLIGPGRTGTSWVTKNLMLHPDIFMPRSKSVRFFITNYDKGLDWYLAHFGGRRETAVGESTGGPFGHLDGDVDLATRIQKHLPDVRLVATFRHPVDRAYSAMGRLRAFANPGELNATVDFEDKIKITPRLIDEGKYATHLERWYSKFPKENILVVFYDQMRSDPRGYLRQIYQFLGVDPDFESPLLNQQINATSTVSATSKIRKLVYRALLRLDLFKLSKLVDNSIQRKPEPLRPEVHRRILESYYIDEITRLEQMLNVDLSDWRQI